MLPLELPLIRLIFLLDMEGFPLESLTLNINGVKEVVVVAASRTIPDEEDDVDEKSGEMFDD